MQSPLTPNL